LRVDIFHSGGAGGQNVNKVATAVRITHIPSGIVAICQDERSQHRNKDQAMSVVRARLYDREIERQQKAIALSRRTQVGTGERSEKVRTYNFPQDRVTDHRLEGSRYSVHRVLEGDMDDLLDALMKQDRARRIQEASV